MRYWFVAIETRCGEYEFMTKVAIAERSNKDFDAEEYARGFYGGEMYEDDARYYFNGGEIACCVYDCKEITKEEFSVLRKFI